ncbi:hypothetical protein PTMSG1_09399 [Pyrenophora teres f. maculata]|nr:hypothetical protein PTMSG1_09399 [Pyrenophora teres f. maculata]
MEIPGYNTLVYYATPPHSYIGTTIFLSYILGALYSTFKITFSLRKQYTAIFHAPTPEKDGNVKASKEARAKHIKVYAFLASISFATLSYHMLMFLITHYLEWSGAKTLSLTNVSIDKLKRWMLASTLFYDFAQDLVRDAPNAVWTQAAILGTWFWSIFIGQKARTRKYDASMMRDYILLSQILPISFTVSLFLIQLHLSSPDLAPPKAVVEPKESLNQRRKPIAALQIPNILLNAALLALPALRSHSVFDILLLVSRAVLLLPHFSFMSLRDVDVSKCITVSGGFAMANIAMMRKEMTLSGVIGVLGNGGYAVKTLGWDAVIGSVVFMVLGWGGGV